MRRTISSVGVPSSSGTFTFAPSSRARCTSRLASAEREERLRRQPARLPGHVPQLFHHNALVILSNGSETQGRQPDRRLGALLRVEASRRARTSRARSPRDRHARPLRARRACSISSRTSSSSQEGQGGLIKILAKNHQYLGVNNAIAGRPSASARTQGRLGVFWHTQGCGKSLSMVFFSQKVLRKLPGNWTFLIVTDREELDDQIYKTFAATGAVTGARGQCHARQRRAPASSCSQRQRALRLHPDPEVPHRARASSIPMLSDRIDIIVITDEAHRSQYDTARAEHAPTPCPTPPSSASPAPR